MDYSEGGRRPEGGGFFSSSSGSAPASGVPSASGPVGGRVPPHHLEAESSVLGAILLDNECLHKVTEVGVEVRDFYAWAHQRLFEVILFLIDRGKPVDMITLTAALQDRGEFDKVGGLELLTRLFQDTYAVGNVSYYAKIIREKALLRRVIQASSEVISEAYSGIEDVEGFLDEAEQRLFSVSDAKVTRSFSSMQEILLQNVQSIENLAGQQSEVIGLKTGFTDFDRLTSGLRPGQLIIFAARPGMGKTSLFLSMIQSVAVKEPAVVAIFSLEMSKEELGFRFLSGLTQISSKRLKIGRLIDQDWPRLASTADVLSKTKIYIDDSGELSVMDIRARCRRLRAAEKRLDLIVVDYLQLMQGSKRSQKADHSREREISEISRGLKSLAKEQKVPILALSQLNRGVESRPNKRPLLSDLRESGAIEQDADMVCFIYRDEVYHPDTEDKGIAELIVAKHRAGETATLRLAWLPEYTLFANLAQDRPGTPVSP